MKIFGISLLFLTFTVRDDERWEHINGYGFTFTHNSITTGGGLISLPTLMAVGLPQVQPFATNKLANTISNGVQVK